MVLGLTRRAAIRWIPFTIRALVASGLWLCALPLATAYLYQGWIHRPSSIVTRLKWDLLIGDAISGIVVAAVILVSFLSLMSFADFLRFHWQQDEQGQQGQNQARVDEQQPVEEEDEQHGE